VSDVQSATGSTAAIKLEWNAGLMQGAQVQESAKKIGDLENLFRDRDAWAGIDPAQEVYRVRWWAPVPAGSEGGLFWGVTVLQPGKVGNEFFMTQGHIHANQTRAEFYTTVSGKGLLLQMDRERNTLAEQMTTGSLHYIHGQNAHRVVNVGDSPLIFWACWGSDAGYDYATIRERGFSAIIIEQDASPMIVHRS